MNMIIEPSVCDHFNVNFKEFNIQSAIEMEGRIILI